MGPDTVSDLTNTIPSHLTLSKREGDARGYLPVGKFQPVPGAVLSPQGQ